MNKGIDKKTWESSTFKSIIEIWIQNDKRLAGLASFITDIRMCWSTEISTACAGHGFIFFNPDFFDSIPEETKITVFIHEVWHLILRHLERGKKFDPHIYNIAADHVINLGLEKEGFTFEGTDPYKDIKYLSNSTEQIYNIIYKKPLNKQPKPNTDIHVSAEKIEDLIEGILESDQQGKTLHEQKSNANNKIDQEINIGNISGNLKIELNYSKIIIVIKETSYRHIFKDYLIDPLSGGKRTFLRPNRRQHTMNNNELRLPGKYPKRGHINRLTHLVYALDVSGSIQSYMVQQFHDSVRTIKELLNPEKLTVILFDTKIVYENTFTDKQSFKNIKVKAGGGTSLDAVYKRTKELNPNALVIFTDLEVYIPTEPKWDTIWLLTKDHKPPPPSTYGKFYKIDGVK